MAANLLIYPLDYPATIVGPSELELRVIELEARMEAVAILGLQDRRNAGDDAIDLELKDTSIAVFHSPIPRFGFRQKYQGTKGFLVGGETSDSLTGRIAKFDYLFETVSLIGADLGIARHSSTGTSAVSVGYISGGNTSSNITARIEKLSFDTESVSLLASQLTVPVSEMAGFATTAASFYVGGFSGASNSIVGEFRSLNHTTENTSLLAASLAVPKSNMAMVGNTSQGFSVGGKLAIGTTVYATSIDKIVWLTQEISVAGFSLAAPGVAFNVGLGNDFNGYIVGGRSSAVNTARIDRIAHTTESISPVGISIATPVSDATAVGTAKLGYIMSGGADPTGEFRSTAAVATTQRLTYIGADNQIERVEPLAFNLPFAACGATGVSDYSAGTYNSNSVSIVNLYDGIYSKLGHVHDDRYPLIEQIYYRTDLRRKLNADITFFVNSLNTVPVAIGLGSIDNPFATIGAAVSWAAGFDYNSHSLKIKVADGTYQESIVFDGTEWVGLRSRGKGAGIILEGNTVNPAAVILINTPTTGETGIRVENSLDVWVRGFKMQCTFVSDFRYTISSALYAYNAGVIVYSDMIFGSGFDYQLLARLSSFLTIAGSVYVEANCRVHVHVASGSYWSANSGDQRYAQFPNRTSVNPANIIFNTGLTMFALFEAAGGLIAFDDIITFTGSNVVTGISALIGYGGIIYSSVPVEIDNPAKFAFVPSTLTQVNQNIEVRTSGNQDITGIKTFNNNIRVPNAVVSSDAVNLAQLSYIREDVRNQRDADVKELNNTIGYHANWREGMFRIGPIQIIFGRTVVYGAWQAAGSVYADISYASSAPDYTVFTSPPTVTASPDRLLVYGVIANVDKFNVQLDSPGGNIFQPDNCTLCWIAIGYA